MKSPGVADLAAMLSKASAAYYNSGSAIMDDAEFDAAKDRLERLSPNHPFLDSVGAPVSGRRKKIRLPYRMASLDKIRDDPKKLVAWKAMHDDGIAKYVVSDKLDGVSALLVFGGSGSGVRMYSRGDGVNGQDISRLAPLVSGVPDRANDGLAVRGELVMSKRAWPTGNARNAVSGAVNANSPDPSVAGLIDFIAYELVSPAPSSLGFGLRWLRKSGFSVVHSKLFSLGDLTVESLARYLVSRRKVSLYEIDGVVVSHDSGHAPALSGNPKHAFAFKTILTHDEAEVVVTGVDWKVGKDGYISPTVVFAPVLLAGVRIGRATGFNASFVSKNRIGQGARVAIIRSGDVIPHIVRVIKPAAEPSMPSVAYVWTDSGVDVRVTDGPAGSEQKARALEHFVKTLGVSGVGPGTLRKLADAGVDTVPKLLRSNDLGAAVAASLARALSRAKCVDLMVASNLFGRGIGTQKLALIASRFPEVLAGRPPTKAQLRSEKGVGEATTEAFLSGIESFYDLMRDAGVPCRAAIAQNDAFKKETVVFTGFRSKEWATAVESGGGKMAGGVSKSVTLVVAADANSGKALKAATLGIRVVSKDAFAGMLASGNVSLN